KINNFNLDNTFFKDEANFLDIKNKDNDKLESKNIANRETARIIKHSFEKQDNIIEANRFYALKMKKREEELLDELTTKCNSFKKLLFVDLPEYIVFLIHKISSNHSQSWIFPLFWIIIVTIFNIDTNAQNIFILDNIANKVNPFSIMTDCTPLTFTELIYKITIAYLIYQLIISIRQNTRRN
ncbi:MAG: hypothetical protein U9N59_02290, partial [Campylobacterota bacterium]|nr:hypothetical protein [Campylobacterota bacterium]